MTNENFAYCNLCILTICRWTHSGIDEGVLVITNNHRKKDLWNNGTVVIVCTEAPICIPLCVTYNRDVTQHEHFVVIIISIVFSYHFKNLVFSIYFLPDSPHTVFTKSPILVKKEETSQFWIQASTLQDEWQQALILELWNFVINITINKNKVKQQLNKA